MTERKYLPSLSDLIDRLTIVQLKMIFIPEHREAYISERDDIEHDIDLILSGLEKKIGATELRAITVLMLTNRVIWESESKARAGGNEQDHLLKFTHSINGVRNSAKNVIAEMYGGRKDFKIDALSAELPKEFGSWKGLL